jgi:hypothetical protein
MNNSKPAEPLVLQKDQEKLLKDQVLNVIASRNLEVQRQLVSAIAAELKASVLDCAAAMVYLDQEKYSEPRLGDLTQVRCDLPKHLEKPLTQPGIRLVRYRLDLGNQHKVALDQIKKVLVEESGVDIKNITNVRIMDCYTLIDLPDEMPQEIFHHLKTTEINGQKLDIRRVKPRNKKRGNRKHRHARPGSLPSKKGVGNN